MNLIFRQARPLLTLIALLFFILVGCRLEDNTPPTAVSPTVTPAATAPDSDPTAVPPPQSNNANHVVISELLPGVPGNNNFEFIELYNPTATAQNLAGWSLWYQMRADQEPIKLITFSANDGLPAYGYFLLLRDSQTYDVIGDETYSVALFERQGGIQLRDAQGTAVDQVGWGDAPATISAGTPLAFTPNGSSLERLPGGDLGNGQSTGDNSADFRQQSAPTPQNSGTLPTPLPAERLSISVTPPDQVPPGTEFIYTVTVENLSDSDTAVFVSIPIHPQFDYLAGPNGAAFENGRVTWTLPTVPAGETAVDTITLSSPYTNTDTLLKGYFAEADTLARAYGAPQIVRMGGGTVPISIARDLVGSTVTVEGTATMYTGGFFAGSTGTKFYIEDETGGLQIYVPGGNGLVDVQIGDRVQVTGEIELYRDSLELIPENFDTDIQLIGETTPPTPTPISAADNENNDAILGRLNQIEGIAIRVEEFNFSYEIDLQDEAGNSTLVLIEKDTGITIEDVEVGDRYRMTGVSEFYSARKQLKPRVADDIVEIYPPVLLLSQTGPSSAAAGETVTYAITAVNHTPDPLTNLQIVAPLPAGDGTLAEPLDGGQQVENQLIWTIPQLDGNSQTVTVRYTVTVNATATEPIAAGTATAVADQWTDPAIADTLLTFVGDDGIPIWAIQSPGIRSPYATTEVTTRGIIIGVFPGLDGFWIQEALTDEDPATSAGLFVLMDQFSVPVTIGDEVQVRGEVRELALQTAIRPTRIDDVVVLSSGNLLPEPVPYDPPADLDAALAYNESLEGMLVTLDETAVAIAPSSRFGEYVLAYEKWGVTTVRRTDPAGYLIFVDDGSSDSFGDQSELPVVVTVGDRVSNITGPLAYTFGNYKIAPLAVPMVEQTAVPNLPTLPPLADNQFSIATFNVENLFDNRDPHPSSPERPLRRVYEQRLSEIALAIEAMGFPTIIGLQEVENIGVLEALVAEPLLQPFGYAPFLVEGFDSRGIDVGYLVRSDQATVELVSNEGAPETIFARPPLLLQATLLQNGQTLYVLNNHFLSLSAGEAATEPVRTAQAQWNADLVAQLQADDPDASFVVLGDLNSFYQTLPLDTLEAVGLQHVYRFLEPGREPYTYIFEGRTQTLDHILVSPALFGQLTAVSTLPINANYPIADEDDPAPWRISDHDPLIAVFTME